MASDFETFEAGELALDSGATLPAARLAYKAFGTLNPARDNVIVAPTHYAGQHDDTAWLVGEDRALDPRRYFIIIPNMLGNGLSSSPSNTPAPLDGPHFPRTTLADNVRLQHRLLTQHLGVTRIQLVVGFSMGAQQAYHWGAMYPELVERIAPICGSARTSRHNFVFLEGLKAALTADAAFADGDYAAPPVTGLQAFARVYAGWMFSQAFYREQVDLKQMGAPDLETFLSFLGGFFLARDANDLLAMLWSWQNADISANARFNGDLDAALAAIRARAVVMPSETDLYFPVADNAAEVARMPSARLQPIPSIWGHMAASGLNPVDAAFIDAELRALLAAS
jgi:homoserine O-acetyltransferase/O-succinyltransferase